MNMNMSTKKGGGLISKLKNKYKTYAEKKSFMKKKKADNKKLIAKLMKKAKSKTITDKFKKIIVEDMLKEDFLVDEVLPMIYIGVIFAKQELWDEAVGIFYAFSEMNDFVEILLPEIKDYDEDYYLHAISRVHSDLHDMGEHLTYYLIKDKLTEFNKLSSKKIKKSYKIK